MKIDGNRICLSGRESNGERNFFFAPDLYRMETVNADILDTQTAAYARHAEI
jgi:hypothetical protein